MNIKRIVIALLLCFASAAWARGQVGQLAPAGVEYGDLSELVGKRRVFVHAENLGTRDKIVKELVKASLPGLEVVGRAEDADFLLVFDAGMAQASQGAFENFSAGGGDGAVAVSGGLIALRIVGGEGGEGQRTRILWHAHKRQTFIRTEQFFRSTYSNNTRSNLMSLAIGGLLASVPKLSMIPVGKSPEVKATRDFVKALKKAYERRPEYAQTSPYLPPAAGEHWSAKSPAFAGEPRSLQWPAASTPLQLGEGTLRVQRLLHVPVARATALNLRGVRRGRRSHTKVRRRSGRVNKSARVSRPSKARIARGV